MARAIWANTTGLDHPENGSAWAAAAWLCGRHRTLAALVDRVGVANNDPEDPGRPDIDLDALAEAFLELERVLAEWEKHEHSKPRQRVNESDQDYERRYQEWEDAGPKATTPAAAAISPMSGTEQGRLRLLATLSTRIRVPLHRGDLWGFDEDGQHLIADWCQVLQR